MRNRPFSFVFLGAVAAALLVQFGREILPIISLPAHDREGPFWLFRESVLWQALPYGVLCLLVPLIRLPTASRALLISGFAVVAYLGVFDIGGLHMGGGENGLVAFACLNAQIVFAIGVVLLALVAKNVQCTTYHRKKCDRP
jgi:hypothetical protein